MNNQELLDGLISIYTTKEINGFDDNQVEQICLWIGRLEIINQFNIIDLNEDQIKDLESLKEILI